MKPVLFVFVLLQLLGYPNQNYHPLLSLFRGVRVWDVHYYDDHITYKRYATSRSIEGMEVIAQVLEKNGFRYNPDKDTLLICCCYPDNVITRYPERIQACSSVDKVRLLLKRNDNNTVEYVSNNQEVISDDALLNSIRNNDVNAFSMICDNYYEPVLDSSPQHVFRYEIDNNTISSCSEWLFDLSQITITEQFP